jgi:hypothetical protein
MTPAEMEAALVELKDRVVQLGALIVAIAGEGGHLQQLANGVQTLTHAHNQVVGQVNDLTVRVATLENEG